MKSGRSPDLFALESEETHITDLIAFAINPIPASNPSLKQCAGVNRELLLNRLIALLDEESPTTWFPFSWYELSIGRSAAMGLAEMGPATVEALAPIVLDLKNWDTWRGVPRVKAQNAVLALGELKDDGALEVLKKIRDDKSFEKNPVKKIDLGSQ